MRAGHDSELVAAARAGEAWALTEIWTRFAPAVTGYLRGRGAGEPDDMASDVFLAVFERIREFQGDDDALRAFVFTVAHHRLVDEMRRRQRRAPSVPYQVDTDERLVASAEDEVLEALRTAHVHQLLSALSDDQREVILLRVLGDLSLEQTATITGKNVGAVKALQHRALAALRKSVEPAVSL